MNTQTIYDEMLTCGYHPDFINLFRKAGISPGKIKPLGKNKTDDDDFEQWLKQK